MMNQSDNFWRYSGQVYLPLYKYFSNYEYAEDAIVKNRIHLEVPHDYNDIYDSAFVLSPETLKHCVNTKKNVCNILRSLLPEKYQAAISACEKTEDNYCFSIYDFVTYACSFDQLIDEQILISECISSIEDGGLIQACNNRISCFSERNDSILMWSYYASNHTGVCLGFDIASDKRLRCYCSKINYSHFFMGKVNTLDNYFIKSDEWSHEQEWRIVCYTDNEYLTTQSLKTIILGARIPDDKRNRFVELGKTCGLQVYQIKPSTTEFKLNLIYVAEDNQGE